MSSLSARSPLSALSEENDDWSGTGTTADEEIIIDTATEENTPRELISRAWQIGEASTGYAWISHLEGTLADEVVESENTLGELGSSNSNVLSLFPDAISQTYLYEFDVNEDTQYEDKVRRAIRELHIFILVQKIKALTNIPYGEKLASRIKELFKARKDRYPDDWEFSVESLSGFYNFIKENPYLTYPNLSISTSGLIIAQWRSLPEHFSLEFQDYDEVIFSVKTEDVQVNGKSEIDVIDQTIEAYNIDTML